MWCDNCLLLLPLRSGAIAWGVIIFLYSIAGGIFLLQYGQFFFFTFPEWYFYGVIGLAVGLTALINIFALSNRSYLWSRVCRFSWPFVIVTSGVRAVVMILELNRGQSNIVWECQNGGQLWPASAKAQYGTIAALPAGFCVSGYQSLYTAFIVGLLVDLGFQIYMLFLNWRYTKLLEHYQSLKGPSDGGIYSA